MTRVLAFVGKFKEKILSGEKNITIRYKKIPKIKEGDIVEIDCGGKIIGKARIKRIEKKKIKDLTEDELKRDGINSKEELIKELRKLYKEKIDENTEVYVIEFELIEKCDIDHYAARYKDYNLMDLARIGLGLEELDEKEKEILKLFLESGGSIRAAAMKLGGLGKRKIIRRVLRKVVEILEKRKDQRTVSSSS